MVWGKEQMKRHQTEKSSRGLKMGRICTFRERPLRKVRQLADSQKKDAYVFSVFILAKLYDIYCCPVQWRTQLQAIFPCFKCEGIHCHPSCQRFAPDPEPSVFKYSHHFSSPPLTALWC